MNTRFVSVLLSLVAMFSMVMSSFNSTNGAIGSKSTLAIVPANVVSYTCDSPDGLDVAVFGGLPVSHDDVIDRHCVAPRIVGTMTHKALVAMPIVVTTAPIVVHNDVVVDSNNDVVVDSNDDVVVVDNSDVVIIVEVTPEPVAEEENTCKNKNSGKDGTPDECNAGGGQEKKDN